MSSGATPSARRGRAPATTREELGRVGLEMFVARGFAAVTVDDIAQAAGIGRRTFFRYFASKNDVPWGDFEDLIHAFRVRLRVAPSSTPVIDAIHAAVLEFNAVPAHEIDHHRHRMRILLTVPDLVAESTVRYAEWRAVIAEFVAQRSGLTATDPVPQAVSWACLGISLAAYERWLEMPDADLLALIDEAFAGLAEVFAGASS